MREFLQRVHSLDIQCIKEDFVTSVEHQSQSSSLVIVSFHVIPCLADHRLRFFNCCPHSFCEFVDYL